MIYVFFKLQKSNSREFFISLIQINLWYYSGLHAWYAYCEKSNLTWAV